MKAKDYYNSTRMVETRNWTLSMVMNFAEEYYEARTKATDKPKEECEVCNNEQVFQTSQGEIADCPRCN